MLRMTAAVLCTALGFAAVAAAGERQDIRLRTDDRPFSDAVRVGDLVFLAGKLGLEPGTRKVPEDPKVEARNALDGMKKTLAELDLGMDHLVSVQVFCSDVSLYDEFNEVYRTYFDERFPARAFIGSGELLFGARFEIQGIAHAGGGAAE